MLEEIMQLGITLLIIIAVPLIFQVVKLSFDQKARYEDMTARLNRIEEKLEKL